MEIRLDDLKTAVDLLVNKVKRLGISTVKGNGYHRSVPAGERENVSWVDDWKVK